MGDLLSDFATLFAYLWYRDFPTHPVFRPATRGRADWTIHLGVVVRGCADLLGFFAEFEQGKRTDARLLAFEGAGKALREVASIEWEWEDPQGAKFNEARKLLKRAESRSAPEFLVLITYSKKERLEDDRQSIGKMWKSKTPLLLISIEYSKERSVARAFERLHFSRICENKVTRARPPQAALPYEREWRREQIT